MDTCASCYLDVRAGARFCPRCGASRSGDLVEPGPEPPGSDLAPPGDHHQRGSALGTGSLVFPMAVAVVVLLAVIATVLGLRPDDPAEGAAGSSAPELSTTAPTTTIPPRQADRPRVVAAVATCTAKSSRDAGGAPTSYEAARAVDGDTATAWRCQGDGSGQQLRLTFDGSADVHGIGVIPGLAKSDPVDGTDRYAQNRRLSTVRYDFDDGASVVQQCDTSGANRSVQSVAVQGVRASSVTITILGSVPGSEQNEQAAVDTVAISEVVVA